MDESYQAALTLWPAGTLAAGVAEQLHRVGVDPSRLHAKDGSCTAGLTAQGEVVLNLSFDHSPFGLTDLEGVIATARIAYLSYLAWDTKHGEVTGTGRFYTPDGGEREFTVLQNGEPVLTRSDLDSFEHYGSAEALLHEIRGRLRLPVPEHDESQAVVIAIEDNDEPEF